MADSKNETLFSPQRLNRYFADYGSFHETRGNRVCHYFGVTSILATSLGLLSHLIITSGTLPALSYRIDGGTVAIAVALIWYFVLDWRLALPFAFTLSGLYFLSRALPLPWLWTLFILGWVIQFVGHYVYEKKSPAFYKNLEHLLIGPLWIFAKTVRYIG